VFGGAQRFFVAFAADDIDGLSRVSCNSLDDEFGRQGLKFKRRQPVELIGRCY